MVFAYGQLAAGLAISFVKHKGDLEDYFVSRDFVAIDLNFLLFYPSAAHPMYGFSRAGNAVLDGVFKTIFRLELIQ